MSCFKGQMEEYTAIAIDRFDGKNLQCTAFFLSHCHKDHMVGLNRPAFHECLRSRKDVFLYCTEITRMLLLVEDEYLYLDKFIRILDVGSSQHLCVTGTAGLQNDMMVRVTPISAGHCPGSAMFLFEGDEGTALYTGDFRWEVNQVTKIPAFREGSHIKAIKSVYIDTTFCIPEAFHIPSRTECLEATLDLVSDWLGRNDLHVVSLSCPAKYGHEHLLAKLGQMLNSKIHVPKWKTGIYNQIPELKGIFSDDPNECRIHACTWKIGVCKSWSLPCGHTAPDDKRFRILNIRPSTMWFTSEKTRANTRDLVVAPPSHRGLHRVCYSMHSSYSEIRDVISFLKPDKALPNVLPAPDDAMETVQKRLNGFRQITHKARLSGPADGERTYVPLGLLKRKQSQSFHSQKNKLDPGCNSSDELVFSSQEQSPNKLKCADRATAGRSVPRCPNGDPTEDRILSKSQSESSSLTNSIPGKDEELNLFSDDDSDKNTDEKVENEAERESLRLYISGESEVEEDDEDEEIDKLSLDSSRKRDDDSNIKNDEKPINFLDKPQVKNMQNYVSELREKVIKPHDFKILDSKSAQNHNIEAKNKIKNLENLNSDRLFIPDLHGNNSDNSGNSTDTDNSEVIPNSQETPAGLFPFKAYVSSQPDQESVHSELQEDKTSGTKVSIATDGHPESLKGNGEQISSSHFSSLSPDSIIKKERACELMKANVNRDLKKEDCHIEQVDFNLNLKKDKDMGSCIVDQLETGMMTSKSNRNSLADDNFDKYIQSNSLTDNAVYQDTPLKVNDSSQINYSFSKEDNSTTSNSSSSNLNQVRSSRLNLFPETYEEKECEVIGNETSNKDNDFHKTCLITGNASSRSSTSMFVKCPQDRLSDMHRPQYIPDAMESSGESDLVITKVSSPSPLHNPFTSISAKRKTSSSRSNSDGEDNSVEFLYEHSPLPERVSIPDGKAWLSKSTPRSTMAERRMEQGRSRSKMFKSDKSFSTHDSTRLTSHSPTIDLTLDD